MPKIVNISKDKIIETTKELIRNQKFTMLNCRGIAEELGVAVGTIYNYFKSKNDIFAYIILEDWNGCFKGFNVNTSILDGVKDMYNCLLGFCEKYKCFFDYVKTTQTDYVSYLNSKHDVMVKLIQNYIIGLFMYNNKEYDKDIVIFIAEDIISSTAKGKKYINIEKIYKKLLGE